MTLSENQFVAAASLLGQAQLQLEEYAGAYAALLQASTLDPSVLADREFLYSLAKAAIQTAARQNDPSQMNLYAQDGLKHVQSVIEMDGAAESADAFHQRAVAFRLLGSLGMEEGNEKALADLLKATQLDATRKEFQYDLGLTYYQMEEFEKSLEALAKAIELAGPEGYIDALTGRSAVYVRMGRLTESEDVRQDVLNKALADCQAAIAIDPEQTANYFNAGLAHRYLGDLDAAIDDFSKCIELAPAFAEAYLRRGITWYHMGDYGLAEADFEEALMLPIGPDRRLRFWLGLTQATQGDYAAAIKSYNAALTLDPAFAEAHLNRSLAYFQLGDYATAIDGLNKYIRLKPADASGYYHRGVAQARTGKLQEAARSFERARRLDPADQRSIQMLNRVRQRTARR
jgi:tetratricopeptide (TPR) repeat protein